MGSRSLFLLALCAPIAFAQSNTATIRGMVTDALGAVVAGAKVIATDAGTGVSTAVQTNDTGIYSLPNLPIGLYSLTVRREGFRTYVRDGIRLTTGEVLGLDIPLEVGAVSESVTVTGTAPLIQSRTSDVSQLMESRSVEDLPLGDRQALNIVKMTGAAVYVSNGTSATSTPNISLAGGRTQSQMFWIDGGAAQNMRLGVGGIDQSPPVEAVDEIRILSNNYAAEYGGTSSGVVMMTTRSGTNQFHGTAYEYLRNNVFDAPGFFAPVRNGEKTAPSLRHNLFGGTLGGPLRRDKTFFFAAVQGSLRRQGTVSTLNVPTALQSAGDFSQTVNAKGQVIPIYDPSTTTGSGGTARRSVFSGNLIPASQLDPVGLKIASFYPQPNRAPDSLTGANNFRANYIVGTTSYNITSKVDHNFNDSNKVTGRFLLNHDVNDNTSVFPDVGADPTTYALDWQEFWYGSWTRILGSSRVNEFRFTFEERVNHVMTQGIGGNYPQKLGLKGVSDNAFPQILPAGFSNLGSGAQERRQYPIRQWQWVDNFSWTRGRHALKFGAEVRRSRNYEINLSTASGVFNFSTQPTGLPGNSATGNGLATLLLGFPTLFSATQTEVIDRAAWYLAGFVQDDYTVNESLTLNIGLRWETDTAMKDANNRMNGFDPNQINPVSGTPGVAKFMGVNGFRTTPFDADWNNFGPRFGFAWKPFRSSLTVVRGGYGIFYSHPFDAGQPASAALGFSRSASLSTPDNGLTAPFYLRNGVPAGVSLTAPVLDDSFGAVPVGKTTTTAVTYFDPRRRTGYVQQFNLSLQRQLRGDMAVEMSAIGSMSRKLPSANLPINQIPPQVLGPSASTQAYRPFPQFTNVQILGPTLGVSSYFGGLLRLEKRFSRGFNLLGTYTWSKFMENATYGAIGTVGTTAGYSNYYNRRADWGPSGNDIRHRITFAGVFELPFGPGRRWLAANPLRHLAGGWSIGNVTNLQTGPPITVNCQTNTTNAFSASLRANVLRDPNLASGQRTVQQWFDTGAFAQPAMYTFGNQGPGLVRAPGLVSFDFSLLRNFHITERLGLQFRGDFLNAFNHTNLGVPGAAFGGGGFGVIGSEAASNPARRIQLGARLRF